MSRQKEVLQAFGGNRDLELSKKKIIELAGLYYYHSTGKHAGDVLSRMVKQGLLKRVKKGTYALGSGIKKKEQAEIPNQTKLL